MFILAKEMAQWQAQTVYRNVDDERIEYTTKLIIILPKLDYVDFLIAVAVHHKKKKKKRIDD